MSLLVTSSHPFYLHFCYFIPLLIESVLSTHLNVPVCCMSIRGNGGHTRCPALQCKAFLWDPNFYFFAPASPLISSIFALRSPLIFLLFEEFAPCSPLFLTFSTLDSPLFALDSPFVFLLFIFIFNLCSLISINQFLTTFIDRLNLLLGFLNRFLITINLAIQLFICVLDFFFFTFS